MLLSNVLGRIRSREAIFTKSQKRIANYIVTSYRQAAYMSAVQMGQALGMSDATVIRFARSLGYSGFAQMQRELKEDLNKSDNPIERFSRFEQNPASPHPQQLFIASIQRDMDGLQSLLAQLDFDLLEQVVEEIYQAKKIHLVGVGMDATIAQMLFWSLTAMKFNTRLLDSCGMPFVYETMNISPGDLVIISMNPRRFKEEIQLLKELKEKKVKTVIITDQQSWDLISYADFLLAVPTRSNVCPSYINSMCLCNLILLGVYQRDPERIQAEIERTKAYVNHFA